MKKVVFKSENFAGKGMKNLYFDIMEIFNEINAKSILSQEWCDDGLEVVYEI